MKNRIRIFFDKLAIEAIHFGCGYLVSRYASVGNFGCALNSAAEIAASAVDACMWAQNQPPEVSEDVLNSN